MMPELGLIEPKEIQIDGRNFIISKFPAIAGREIVTQFIPSAIPKLGEYRLNENLMRKSISYVAVQTGAGQYLRLNNDAAIDNHVGGFETLMKLEWAMMEYNCSFFRNGQISNFFDNFGQTARTWITKTLMDFSAQLSPKAEPPSAN